jgi:serine/threonine protein kinase
VGLGQAAERFRREAQAASALSHPNICTIHDIDEHEGRHFIAMELVEGQALRRLVQTRRLDVDEILDLGIQIADGLGAAHAQGIVHRDVKPANVLVTKRGQAKILDFGLAKLVPERRSASEVSETETKELLTSPGSAVGTVAYMSPEQALGEPLDARTDLFSLGVVLYEMSTGRLPFRGDTSAAVFDGIQHRAPTSPVRLNPDLPQELERILNKALEKDREVRYQTARDLLVDLKRPQRESDSRRSASVVRDEAKAAFSTLAREHLDNIDCLGRLGSLAARGGGRAEAFRFAEKLRTLDRPYLWGNHTYRSARILALLGDKEGATARLREAVAQGSGGSDKPDQYGYGFIYRHAMELEPLQGYPPFEELIKPKG